MEYRQGDNSMPKRDALQPPPS
uniref:Uncharacterized protein n=1 Tax=Arundo donax TaxID=35708 RepID=A0A0A9B6P2_ARUDO